MIAAVTQPKRSPQHPSRVDVNTRLSDTVRHHGRPRHRRSIVAMLALAGVVVTASCSSEPTTARSASLFETERLYSAVTSKLDMQIDDRRSGTKPTGYMDASWCDRPPQTLDVGPGMWIGGSHRDSNIAVVVGFASRWDVSSYLDAQTMAAQTCARDIRQGFRSPNVASDVSHRAEVINDEPLRGVDATASSASMNITGTAMVRGLDSLAIMVLVSGPYGSDTATKAAELFEVVVTELESRGIIS